MCTLYHTQSTMDMNERFNFYHLDHITFPFLEKRETKELLTKWSMINGMQFQGYTFDRPFKKYLQKDFVQDFFTNQNVISTLQRATEYHSFVPLGIPGETVQMKEIPCTHTSMNLFDRLKGPVTREKSGAFIKCIPEYYKSYGDDGKEQNEIEISDELRKMLITPEESDCAELFRAEEKHEFLFQIFRHLVIGGSLCQFEDYVHPYLELSKGFYKDLISVASFQKTNPNVTESEFEISTTSTVIQIFSATCDSYEPGKNILFPTSQYNNFFYLAIDPNKRLIYTWYHHV